MVLSMIILEFKATEASLFNLVMEREHHQDGFMLDFLMWVALCLDSDTMTWARSSGGEPFRLLAISEPVM